MRKFLRQALTRRDMFAVLGGFSAAAIFGWERAQSAARASDRGASAPLKVSATPPFCVVRPEQTEGPYFIDEKLNRSDIRVEPSDRSIVPGVPLRLAFRVSRVDGRSCTPLSGALVNLWQCDALGVYSDVRDTSAAFDTRGKQFLRGHQSTDGDGVAQFVTIYPGWYGGRTVHIHFKIRTDSGSTRGTEFTSQLYFDDSISDEVQRLHPYSTRGRRTTTNDRDFLFRRSGKQLMLRLTKDNQGYAAMFDIGLQFA